MKRILIALLLASCAFAQTTQPTTPAAQAAPAAQGGSISGSVTSGKVPLPGVTVTAQNTLTGKKVIASTDLDGTFKLEIPRNGKYVVRTELAAFAPLTQEVLINAEKNKHELKLEMQLQSRVDQQAAQSNNAMAQALAGRGFQSLGLGAAEGGEAAAQMPTAPTGGADMANAGGTGANSGANAMPMGGDTSSESVSVTGNMGRTESFGMNNDDLQDRLSQIRDQIARGEFQGGGPGGGGLNIQIGGPGGGGMPMGGGGGAPMIIMAGPGGASGFSLGGPGGRGFNINQPHGMINYNLSSSVFDAKSYGLNGPTSKPEYSQHRIMATLGGPLVIPKIINSPRTFYFINYFGNVATNPLNSFSTVPTDLERAGDFSQTFFRTGPNAGQLVPIIDPNTGLPFAGNKIPTNRLNSAALGLLNFVPHASLGGSTLNYNRVDSSENLANNLNIRFQHSFGDNNQNNNRRQNAGNQGSGQARGQQRGGRQGGGAGNPFASRHNIAIAFSWRQGQNEILNSSPFLGGNNKNNGMNLNVNYVKGKGRLTNRAGFSWNLNETHNANLFAAVNNVAGALGITGVSTDPLDWGPSNLSFTNYSGIRDITPLDRTDKSWGLNDNVSWSHGKHNMRFGVDYRQSFLELRSNSNPRGTFTFTGIRTGYDFADFLLGLPQQTSIQFGPNRYNFTNHNLNFFVQDDWRIHSKLTLNLGLRYEYISPYTEDQNRLVNLDAASDFSAVAPVQAGGNGAFTGAFPKSLVNPDRNNWAPRIGIAWSPVKQTVIRAGYGLNYNLGAYQQFVQQLAFQPPFYTTQTNVLSNTLPLTLQAGFPTQVGVLTNNFGVDKDYRMGYAQSWNLDVQRGLPKNMTLNVGYVGTKGTRLDTQRAPNRCVVSITCPTGLRIPGVQAFIWQSSEAASILHSGSVRLRKRMQKGIAVGGSYTYAKSIDNASNIGGGANVVAQNDLDLAAERGLSSFDQRHRFNMDYTIELPWGTNKKWLSQPGKAKYILGDWTLSGNLAMNAGTPFTPRVIGSFGDVARGLNGTLRANYLGGAIHIDDPTIAHWFNTSAYGVPVAGTFGNAGRNSIIGPGSVTLDMSVNKTFQIKDMKAFTFRATASNLLNHANYTSIDTTVNSPSFGRVLNVAPMRRIQLNMGFRF